MVALVRDVEATESNVTTECLNRGSDSFHILGVNIRTTRCKLRRLSIELPPMTLSNMPVKGIRSLIVCFSNRPVMVKHFQTIHHCSVDVAHGLALLFGIGTEAVPSWDSRIRRNNLLRGLTVRVTAGPSRQTNSPHPSSREGHLSTA